MTDEKRRSEYEMKREYMQRMLNGYPGGGESASSFIQRVQQSNPGLSPASRLKLPNINQLKELGMNDNTAPMPTHQGGPDPANNMVIAKAYHDLERQAAAFRMICNLEKDKVGNFSHVSHLVESIFLLQTSLSQVQEVLGFLQKQCTGMMEHQKRLDMNVSLQGAYPVTHTSGYINAPGNLLDDDKMKEIEERVIKKFMDAMRRKEEQ